jgi:V8-like Glu-specific endopeptidase
MTPFDETPSLVLDRLADRADYAIIGPTDGRTRVLQTSRPPYAAVCQIERDFGDGRLSGCSGFLVSPSVVVTAGHCVFSRPRHLMLGRGAPRRIPSFRRATEPVRRHSDTSGRYAGMRTGASSSAATSCTTSASW